MIQASKGAELAIAGGLALVYFTACLPKLRRPRGFILLVLEYRILPPVAARAYAVALPPLELVLAVLLATGAFVRGAAVGSAMILTGFIVGTSVNLRRGRDLDCGCFGSQSRRISWLLVAQDAVLLAASLVAAPLAGSAAFSWWSPVLPIGGSAPGLSLVLALAPFSLFVALVAVNAVRVGYLRPSLTDRDSRHSVVTKEV